MSAQRERVLKFLLAWENDTRAPTMREMSDELGMSVGSVKQFLNVLVSMGLVTKTNRKYYARRDYNLLFKYLNGHLVRIEPTKMPLPQGEAVLILDNSLPGFEEGDIVFYRAGRIVGVLRSLNILHEMCPKNV